MKAKFVSLYLMMTLFPAASMGQKAIGNLELGSVSQAALSIPKEFTYNGVPCLMMYDSYDRNVLKLYDENLEEVKSITMKEEIPFQYQLTYQDQVRDVTAVSEANKIQFCEYSSYEAFVQHEQLTEPGFSESDLVIVDLGGGERRISFNYSEAKYPYKSNYDMYYGYSLFDKQYPKVYFIDGGKEVKGYQVAYVAQYSEWRTEGTRVVDCVKSQQRIPLCNINLNQGDGQANSYFEVSQTLFNKDAGYEYIMPKYKLSASGNVNEPSNSVPSEPSYGDNLTTTRSIVISEEKEIVLEGFQILSENGDVVSDITFDNGFEGSIYLECAFVITIGNKIYLAFDGQSNGDYVTVFYKIDNALSSIQKVKMAPSSMSVSPTFVKRGSTISINFEDGNKQGSDLVVSSVSGVNVQRLKIPAGQTSVQIPSLSSSGMYCVRRIVKGGNSETKKFIVR